MKRYAKPKNVPEYCPVRRRMISNEPALARLQEAESLLAWLRDEWGKVAVPVPDVRPEEFLAIADHLGIDDGEDALEPRALYDGSGCFIARLVDAEEAY